MGSGGVRAPVMRDRKLLLSSLWAVVVALLLLGAAFRASEAGAPPVAPGGSCIAASFASCTQCIRQVLTTCLADSSRCPCTRNNSCRLKTPKCMICDLKLINTQIS